MVGFFSSGGGVIAANLFASRSHCDKVGWDTPTCRASTDALTAPGPTIRFTTCALNASVYGTASCLLSPPGRHQLGTSAEATTSLTQGGGVADLTFSPDGRELISTGMDRQTQVWSTETFASLRTFQEPRKPQSLALDAQGRRLMTGLSGGGIIIRELHGGGAVSEIPTEGFVNVLELQVNEMGDIAYSGVASIEGAGVWSIANGGLLVPPRFPPHSMAEVVALSPDARLLAYEMRDRGVEDPQGIGGSLAAPTGRIGVLNLGSDRELHHLPPLPMICADNKVPALGGLSFTPGGELIAVQVDGSIVKSAPPFSAWSQLMQGDRSAKIRRYDVSRKPFRLALLEGPSFRIVDPSDVREEQKVNIPFEWENLSSPFVLSPAARHVAMGLSDGRIALFDLQAVGLVGRKEPLASEAGAFAVAVSADARSFASWGTSLPVKTWRANNGNLQALTPAIEAISLALAYRAQEDCWEKEGTTSCIEGFLSAHVDETGTIHLYEGLPSGTEKKISVPPERLPGPGKLLRRDDIKLALSASGLRLAACSGDDSLLIWKLPEGTLQSGTDGIPCRSAEAIAFGAKGEFIAVTAAGHQIEVWNLRTRERRVLPGTGDRIWSLALSPDGTLLASGHLAGYVQLWDVEKGEPLHPFLSLKMHRQAVSGLAFSRDGSSLISAGNDDHLMLLDMRPESWVQEACRRSQRVLSEDEQRQYLGPGVEPRACSLLGSSHVPFPPALLPLRGEMQP